MSSIEEVLERTAGRTIFTCHHPQQDRRIYDDMCEVCWECRTSRGKDRFGTPWAAVTRIQLPCGRMLSTDGRSVAHQWNMGPLN